MITTVWQPWSLTNCDVIGKFTWNRITGLEIRKLEVSSAPRHQWTRGNPLFFSLHMLYVCSAQCRRDLCNTNIKYKIRTGCHYIVHTRGVHGWDFGFFGSLLLLPPTGSGMRLFAVDGTGMYLDFVIIEKNVAFLLAWLYLCAVKQDSDCLCHVGTEYVDSEWKFGKQDGIRTQKSRARTPLVHTQQQKLWTRSKSPNHL